MNVATADRPKLAKLLADLATGIEELLLSGLTTASTSTRQTLDVAFREASRMRLLRLGSTLRIAGEELGRFTSNHADFSRQRLFFFLSRAWLLSRGLARALAEQDDAAFDRLLWTPASTPLDRLQVVTLGAGKKVSSAFVAYEFRLRALADAGHVRAGQRLTWSCVFPLKPGLDVPAEGFLHLPQKQKFNASIFLDRQVIEIANAAVAVDEAGQGRISLGERSVVTAGARFENWAQFLFWDRAAAAQRVRVKQPGPLDLEVDLQEEVVLNEWQIGAPAQRKSDGAGIYPITSGLLTFDGVGSAGVEGKALRARLEALRKKKARPPLFGLVHYEKCRLVMQPLAVFDGDGPTYLTISDEAIDRAALLKALKLT